MVKFLRYLWGNEDGFFGIGQGPTDAQKSEAGAMGAIGNFGTSEGESDIMASDKFWKSIMSGDPGAISQVLGPAISGINKRAQESKKNSAEFGNRSGGTNAGMQMTDDSTRASIDKMVAQLTGQGADTLGSTGGNLLNTGLAGHEGAFSADTTIQKEQAAKWNDIFNSIQKSAETAAIIA